MTSQRRWTIYLTQDKHLDYNWCGTHTEVELRMAQLLDYFIDLAEKGRSRYNLDCTLWLEVYRRQRGEAGAQRLLEAIRANRIGYAATHSVLLFGLLSEELSLRALYGSLEIEHATGTPNTTALIMENVGLPWGLATLLGAAGMADVGRGVYRLRAESYIGQRDPYPLFWWIAPDGQRLLVRWDLYDDTRSWGGYAEASQLGFLGGQVHDPYHMQAFDASDDEAVYAARCAFIRDTVARYEAYGANYPISSILLLGTGHDQWALTEDYRRFVERYNLESDGSILLSDALYRDFFQAAREEIAQGQLEIPALRGSFGICWEEWGAHLGGQTALFRRADRLLRLAEAEQALALVRAALAEPSGPLPTRDLLRQAHHALLDYAEHDMGGIDRSLAAISAGVRAGAATQALDIAQALGPRVQPSGALNGPSIREEAKFAWRGGRVSLDQLAAGIASYVDASGHEWVAETVAIPLGAMVHTLYPAAQLRASLFPEPLPGRAEGEAPLLACKRGPHGVVVRFEGQRYGFGYASRWLFHAHQPWIDITYDLAEGWSDEAQTVQFAFPLALPGARYRYHMAGAIQTAGPTSQGGDDLPGANPSLYAVQTFAAAVGADRHAILVTPDAFLVEFGTQALRGAPFEGDEAEALLASMPLMNLTRTDHQFGQGGQRRWTFRYRLVLGEGPWSDLEALSQAQRFADPPFLQMPGQAPASEAVRALEIEFEGGPVLALKASEDGQRLIVRLWNVTDEPAEGSLALPAGLAAGSHCDALERPQRLLRVIRGRAFFRIAPRTIATLALS